MNFGKVLKELRCGNNMTQSQLAAELGVGEATVRGWENAGKEPSYNLLYKIAKLFGVTVGQLLGVED